MSQLKDIFDKFYKEQILESKVQGKTDYVFPKGTQYPLRVKALKVDGKDIVFAYNDESFRVTLDRRVGFTIPEAPRFDHVFRIVESNSEKHTVEIDYLECGSGEELDSSLEIGFGDDIILAFKEKAYAVGQILLNALGFEDGDRWVVFMDTYVGQDDHFRIHGLYYMADVNRIDGKWKITRLIKRRFPKNYKAFLDFEVRSLKSLVFVDESEARAAAAVIDEQKRDNRTIMQIWQVYSHLEMKHAEEYSSRIGDIPYHVLGYPDRHLCRIMLDSNEIQTSEIYKRKDLFLRSSLELEDGQERYDVVSMGRGSTVCITDKNEDLPRSGKLKISIKGNVTVNKRRENAYRIFDRKPNALLKDLLFAIEGKMDSALLRKPEHYKAITERTRKFLKKEFGIDDVTQDQKEAIEIALNTPDIAIIQGPPGTGKSTVIAAIADRLLEIAEKERVENEDKLILVSAFQNDTVEHIASKIYILGLPTVKVGKKAQGTKAEDAVIDDMKRSMSRAMDYYKNFAQSDISSALAAQRDIFLKEHTLSSVSDAVDKILAENDLGDEVNETWNLYKMYDYEDERKYARQLKALNNLRTDSVEEYNKDGFKNIRRVISKVELDDDDMEFLQSAPKENADDDFLDKLEKIKSKYQERYTSRDEATGIGSLGAWFDQAIDAARAIEQAHPLDKNAYMYRTLETLLNEIDGDQSYIRHSLTNYGEAIAATNQTAGSIELSKEQFEDVILEEAARSNPLDLLIPMTKAKRRIILVGDQKQLPQLLEHDLEEQTLDTYKDTEVKDENKKIINDSLFNIIFKNLSKSGVSPIRYKTLTTQFRMHPVISDFISRTYYPKEGLIPGMNNMADCKRHKLSLPWAKDKVMVFCDVPYTEGGEMGRSKYRPAEAKRIIALLKDIFKDPASNNLSVGVITFYSAQVEEICRQAVDAGYVEKSADNSYTITPPYRLTPDGREKLRIGTVDSFQGKEFDVVILSTVRSNDEKRDDDHARNVFGFLTLENRLNVAFSRAEDLIIAVGDAQMFSDDYAAVYVQGLHDFYKLTSEKYGNRIK